MLVLRDYREDDADRLVELANNEEVSRYMIDTFPYPYTAQDARWWIEEGCRGPGMVTKVIEVDGSFVGSVFRRLALAAQGSDRHRRQRQGQHH